jgi:hypothetical protein
VGSPIHLAFEILEPGNLPFYLPGTPRFTQCGTHGSILGTQSQCKAMQFLQRAGAGLLEPGVEVITFPLAYHRHKSASQRGGFPKGRPQLIEPLAIAGITRRKLVGSTQEQPFRAAWGSEEFVVQPSGQS